MRELISSTTVEGFTLNFYAMPEDESPRGQFTTDEGEDDEETIAKINSGDYLWFQVACFASKEGIDLGSDHLGCCCYETYADFFEPGGYADDMRAEALAEAKATIAKLCAEA